MPDIQRARHTLATYVDTSNARTAGSETYKLIGLGVESLSYEFNPEDEQKFYINQESATTILKSYAPSFSAKFAAIEDADAIDWAEDAIVNLPTGTLSRTYVCTVMMWREGTSTHAGQYRAVRRLYTFKPSSAGGDAGDLEYEIEFSSAGDKELGWASIDGTTGAVTFTADSE